MNRYLVLICTILNSSIVFFFIGFQVGSATYAKKNELHYAPSDYISAEPIHGGGGGVYPSGISDSGSVTVIYDSLNGGAGSPGIAGKPYDPDCCCNRKRK